MYVNSLNLIGVYEWKMIEPVSDVAGQMYFGLREKSGRAARAIGQAKTAFVLSLCCEENSSAPQVADTLAQSREARRRDYTKRKSNIRDSSHNNVPAQAKVTQIPKAMTSNGHRGRGDRVA